MIGSESEAKILNQLQQKKLANEFSKWLALKADVKASIKPQTITNLIHLDSGNQSFTINGNSTISPIGLGEIYSNSFQMNIGSLDSKANSEILEWFNKIWHDTHNEPTRVFRRQFILSHATLADSSNRR